MMLYSVLSLCPRNVQWPPSCSHSWRLALWTCKLLYSSCVNARLFCKIVHLARSTSPSLVAKGFKYDVHHCFALCTGIDTTNSAWEQAQLSLSKGSIGLRSLSDHLSACYIASLSMSSLCLEWISNHYLVHSIEEYNGRIPPTEAITIEAASHTPVCQKDLSSKLENSQFNKLSANSSLLDRARLLSVSSPMLEPGFLLPLLLFEFRTAIQ